MGGEAFAIVESCLHYVNALDFVPFRENINIKLVY